MLQPVHEVNINTKYPPAMNKTRKELHIILCPPFATSRYHTTTCPSFLIVLLLFQMAARGECDSTLPCCHFTLFSDPVLCVLLCWCACFKVWLYEVSCHGDA